MLTTIQPTQKAYDIPYPDKESEFEVQAWLHQTLRAAGFDARGEVKLFGGFGLRAKKASCRFDVVLFDGKRKPVCIFEVKAAPIKHKTCVEDTRQGFRYPQFGVPVHFVYGMDGARAALALALSM